MAADVLLLVSTDVVSSSCIPTSLSYCSPSISLFTLSCLFFQKSATVFYAAFFVDGLSFIFVYLSVGASDSLIKVGILSSSCLITRFMLYWPCGKDIMETSNNSNPERAWQKISLMVGEKSPVVFLCVCEGE